MAKALNRIYRDQMVEDVSQEVIDLMKRFDLLTFKGSQVVPGGARRFEYAVKTTVGKKGVW